MTLILKRQLFFMLRFADGPLVAQRYMKENLNRALSADLLDCLDAEAMAMSRCRTTDDHKEAVAAFVENVQFLYGSVNASLFVGLPTQGAGSFLLFAEVNGDFSVIADTYYRKDHLRRSLGEGHLPQS